MYDKIINILKILAWSINPTKAYFSSSSTFQFSAYILSVGCQGYNSSSWGLNMSRGTKKTKWLQRSMLNIY